MHISFGSDCSGIGCPESALESLNIDYSYEFSSECDIHAKKQLGSHYKSPKLFYEDLTKRNVDDMPTVDLYVAGFPCQSWSTLGKTNGFNDKRGSIFFYIFEYIEKKRPHNFILENVIHLVSHDSGKSFEFILGKLKSLDYTIHWKILNSKDFGVPHNRRRLYIVGTRRSDFAFPDPLQTTPKLEDFIDLGTMNPKQPTKNQILVLNKIKQDFSEKNIDIDNHFHILDLGVSIYRTRCGEIGLCPCLRTRCERYWVTKLNRFLFPYEALWLQGFDKSWESVCSEMQTFKQAGNTMTKTVIKAIIKNLFADLS